MTDAGRRRSLRWLRFAQSAQGLPSLILHLQDLSLLAELQTADRAPFLHADLEGHISAHLLERVKCFTTGVQSGKILTLVHQLS